MVDEEDEEGLGEGAAPRMGVAQADSDRAPTRRSRAGSATRARLERDGTAVPWLGFTRSLCGESSPNHGIVLDR
jgi:hypothetical protein